MDIEDVVIIDSYETLDRAERRFLKVLLDMCFKEKHDLLDNMVIPLEELCMKMGLENNERNRNKVVDIAIRPICIRCNRSNDVHLNNIVYIPIFLAAGMEPNPVNKGGYCLYFRWNSEIKNMAGALADHLNE